MMPSHASRQVEKVDLTGATTVGGDETFVETPAYMDGVGGQGTRSCVSAWHRPPQRNVDNAQNASIQQEGHDGDAALQ